MCVFFHIRQLLVPYRPTCALLTSCNATLMIIICHCLLNHQIKYIVLRAGAMLLFINSLGREVVQTVMLRKATSLLHTSWKVRRTYNVFTSRKLVLMVIKTTTAERSISCAR